MHMFIVDILFQLLCVHCCSVALQDRNPIQHFSIQNFLFWNLATFHPNFRLLGSEPSDTHPNLRVIFRSPSPQFGVRNRHFLLLGSMQAFRGPDIAWEESVSCQCYVVHFYLFTCFLTQFYGLWLGKQICFHIQFLVLILYINTSWMGKKGSLSPPVVNQ